MTDDTTTYPEAVWVTGNGPSEVFTFAIPKDICKKAMGTMKIEVFLNQVTYARTE